MTTRLQISVFRLLALALAVTALPLSAEMPDGVSPGEVDHIAEVEARCPTFIWGAVPGAETYQLVGYRLPEGMEAGEVDLSRAEQVLYSEVPGNATSWTPNLADCLVPGESYVWFVRAVDRDDQGDVVEASEWSYGRFFSISPLPSAREVEEALDVLRRYLGQQSGRLPVDDRSVEASAAGTGRPAPSERRAEHLEEPKSVTSAKAAISGSLSDTTGETYGVVGISNSANGAGLGAANTNGGPDLVLDGSADGQISTRLSQSGIDRRDTTPQTFNIENTKGGGIKLRVEGVDVVTTATDQDTLGSLSCGSGLIARWTGAVWACSSDNDTPPRDPGNQLSLAGNALDVVEGPGSGLDADTLDGVSSAGFATAGHVHFGQTWTGSATDGLKIENNGSHGLHARSIAGSGITYGLYGVSYSTAGKGLYASATATTGETYGVHGSSSSVDGRGVYGQTTASSGATFGVLGIASSTSGTGVLGHANAASGSTSGVAGKSASTEGVGVWGDASALTGDTYGVVGSADSSAGVGVYGHADHASGSTRGVLGESSSSNGRGVVGEATADSGETYGVMGLTYSPTGAGVYASNSNLTGPDLALGGHEGFITATSESYSHLSAISNGNVNLFMDHDDDFDAQFSIYESSVRIFTVDHDGDVFADRGYHCGIDFDCSGGDCSEVELEPCFVDNSPADFAEMLPVMESPELGPGDVLVVDRQGMLARNSEAYEPTVVGVYSTRPSYLGNSAKAGTEGYAPLAILGVVPVKVTDANGPIQPGDMLVSSATPGHAMRSGPDPPQGTVLGKALDGLEQGRGTIRTIVMLQ